MTNLNKNYHSTNANIFLFVRAATRCTIGESTLYKAATRLNIRPESLRIMIDIQHQLKGVQHG